MEQNLTIPERNVLSKIDTWTVNNPYKVLLKTKDTRKILLINSNYSNIDLFQEKNLVCYNFPEWPYNLIKIIRPIGENLTQNNDNNNNNNNNNNCK